MQELAGDVDAAEGGDGDLELPREALGQETNLVGRGVHQKGQHDQ